jgi:transcriptional regulator with XRE-family HTH domain
MNKKVVQFVRKSNYHKGEERMNVGGILKKRMKALGINSANLAEQSLVNESIINDIINNKISIDQIDELDLEFISQILYCSPNYFANEEVRKKDIINSALNRGVSDKKSNNVKGKLQQFANDFAFLRSLKLESESGD